MRRRTAWPRLLAACGFLLLPLGGFVAWQSRPGAMVGLLAGATGSVRTGGPGTVAMVAGVQILIAASGVLPASLIGLVAGALYGIWRGFLLAGISALAGAGVTFWLARSLFRPLLARALPPRPGWRAMDKLIARDGWRLVCLLRVSPVMPFAATSYALGLSSIRVGGYMLGTLLSMPALFGYVVLGHAAADVAPMAGHTDPVRLAMLVVGGLATVLVTIRVGVIARKAIAVAARSDAHRDDRFT